MKKTMENKYWIEYKDLYTQAQKTGKYKVFLFDVKGSRKLYADSPSLLHNNLVTFRDNITKDLLALEQKLGKKILHRHLDNLDTYDETTDRDKVILCKRQLVDYNKKVYRTDCINPLFWLGDLLQFIIERDSISDETFYEVFEKNKKEVIPSYVFYHKSGYYETDVWAESGSKLSRIYCIPILEYLAKKDKQVFSFNQKVEDEDLQK